MQQIFQKTSSSAVLYGRELKEAGCDEVILAYVLDAKETGKVLSEPSRGTEPSGEYERQISARTFHNASQELKNIQTTLEEKNFHVRSFLVTGDPSQEINRIVDAGGTGMIVIGSHGRTNLLHRLMGSVSLDVIQNATHPVHATRRDKEL